MISKKIRGLIEENREFHRVNKQLNLQNFTQLKELEWAHIYHDSIRGREWLEKLPLNIGRWAGNYAFFYVLNRVLNEYKPENILEFGLGESTKFVSTYIRNCMPNTKHLIIEQDKKWHEHFKSIYNLGDESRVEICPLSQKEINSFKVNTYKGLKDVINSNFDLYIIDGPIGSEHFSRYDIVELAKDFSKSDEFVIIIDDFQRKGEKETVKELLSLFENKGILIFKGEYIGNKSVVVLGTEKYKYIQSL